MAIETGSVHLLYRTDDAGEGGQRIRYSVACGAILFSLGALGLVTDPAQDGSGIGGPSEVVLDVLGNAAIGEAVKVHIDGCTDLMRCGVGAAASSEATRRARDGRGLLPFARGTAQVTHGKEDSLLANYPANATEPTGLLLLLPSERQLICALIATA